MFPSSTHGLQVTCTVSRRLLAVVAVTTAPARVIGDGACDARATPRRAVQRASANPWSGMQLTCLLYNDKVLCMCVQLDMHIRYPSAQTWVLPSVSVSSQLPKSSPNLLQRAPSGCPKDDAQQPTSLDSHFSSSCQLEAIVT